MTSPETRLLSPPKDRDNDMDGDGERNRANDDIGGDGRKNGVDSTPKGQ